MPTTFTSSLIPFVHFTYLHCMDYLHGRLSCSVLFPKGLHVFNYAVVYLSTIPISEDPCGSTGTHCLRVQVS